MENPGTSSFAFLTETPWDIMGKKLFASLLLFLMGTCRICKKSADTVSGVLGVCLGCLREDFAACLPIVSEVHRKTRSPYGLPGTPPRDEDGLTCDLCQNLCSIGTGKMGFCGIRRNRDGRLVGGMAHEGNLSYYYDPLPTNCTGDWVCAEGSSTGKREHRKNLAVFYNACPFNCLFCQNHQFKERSLSTTKVPAKELVAAVDPSTACICYFGGDPSPQLLHALAASRRAIKKGEERGVPVRICWETSGSFTGKYLKHIAEVSLISGGLIKFDLKAFDEGLHRALTGASNRQTLENFATLAEYAAQRDESPLLMASTLLVPGYVDALEVGKIAGFIASLSPDIPFSILGFYPHFYMKDLPLASRRDAHEAKARAEEQGLTRVRVGNLHLFQ